MIIITKDEALALWAKYGEEAHITVTNRHKKGGRKKYYAAEDRRNVFFIDRLRNKQSRNAKRGEGRNYGR